MKIEVVDKDPMQHQTEMLIIGVFEGDYKSIGHIDKYLNGSIKEAFDIKEFEGKYGQMSVFRTYGSVKPKRILLMGLGKPDFVDTTRLDRIAMAAAKYVRSWGLKDFSSVVYGSGGKIDHTLAAHKIVEGSLIGLYKLDQFQTGPKKPVAGTFYLMGSKNLQSVVEKAKIEANAVNWAREIANTPANIATPEWMASKGEEVAKETGIKIKIFDKKMLEKEGLNSILAVGKGSAKEPRMVVLEYAPKGAKKTIAFVGKGITYDTGGLNLKPSQFIYWMWMDKCGATYMMAAMHAIAHLKPNVRVVAILPFAENMPSGTAQHPGDVIKTLSGKTIEVFDTDAEGRVLLADAVTYACNTFKPDVVIDMATLTGAASVCVGKEASIVMSNDDELMKLLQKASTMAGERIWQLPTWEEFDELNKSAIADIKNVGAPMEANSIVGGLFIKNFLVGTPKWAHFDIASVAYYEKERPFAPIGASGFGVRLLTEFVELYAQN